MSPPPPTPPDPPSNHTCQTFNALPISYSTLCHLKKPTQSCLLFLYASPFPLAPDVLIIRYKWLHRVETQILLDLRPSLEIPSDTWAHSIDGKKRTDLVIIFLSDHNIRVYISGIYYNKSKKSFSFNHLDVFLCMTENCGHQGICTCIYIYA